MPKVAVCGISACIAGWGPGRRRPAPPLAPPGQLGLGHARVAHLVDHVVDLAAEGVEGGDGGAALGGRNRKA
jgi:hypothetical protein